MADEAAEADAEAGEEAPKKKGKKGLVIGIVLALVLGGGGFFAVYSGMVLAPPTPESEAEEMALPELPALPDVAFVPLDPILVSLGGNARSEHLRFQAQLEVPTMLQEDVVQVLPRIVDVLNGYLRAVDPETLEDPGEMTRLRAQMLRRVQIVTGQDRVRDLLIMEFVLS